MPSAPRTPARERAYWLIKSEPFKYSFADLQRERRTRWDGVRNFEARNALRAMRVGDQLLFYHSNEGKEVVGVARVAKAAYPDPSDEDEGDWSAIDVTPVASLRQPVSLDAIRSEASLSNMAMLKRNRLSVTPVTSDEFATILRMGATTLRA